MKIFEFDKKFVKNYKNIWSRINICQRVYRYLNLNKKSLKSIIIFDIEWKYLNPNKNLSKRIKSFQFAQNIVKKYKNIRNIKIFAELKFVKEGSNLNKTLQL